MLAKFIVCLLLVSCDKDSGAQPEWKPLPEQAGKTIVLHGFTVRVATDFVWNRETDNAYRYLGKVLDDMETVFPAPALKKMQEKELLLTADATRPAIEYRAENEENAGCVVINDLADFYKRSVTNQPYLLVHYLALQYADRFLKGQEGLLENAWQKAVAAGIYDAVDYFDGEKTEVRKAEALADKYAYFSELSEAYWGKNDFFPFDYQDIAGFDPDGFRLMETVWGVREIKKYRRFRIEGYDVMVLESNLSDPLTEEALAFLKTKLEEINKAVPEVFTNFFKRRKIWMEIGSGSTTGGAAEYHSSREWLVENGRFVEKYNCVEIGNMRNFIDWSKRNQPMMVFHELSHYYHKDCMDGDIGILSAYETAMNMKLYDHVDYFDGEGISKRPAYAGTNAMEYFAEMSESYFGKNDYYPFGREELKAYDPVSYKLMEKVWNPENFKE